MAKEFLDFEIRVGQQSADRYTVSVRSPGGDAEASLAMPTATSAYHALFKRLLALDIDEELVNQIGTVLFQILFTPPVKEVYARSQGVLGSDHGLRLRFDIDSNSRDIAELPWEYLCDPDVGPLALLDASVVRYMPVSSVPPQLALPLPFKILLSGVQSSFPDAARELATIQQVFGEFSDQVQVFLEPQLTLQTLQRYLRLGIHIWHFAGVDGADAQAAPGSLLFAGAAGGHVQVRAAELGVMLNRSSVQLAVLSSGRSGGLLANPWQSIAPVLIRAQLPAVVAMQFAVQPAITQAFATEFYRALIEGYPIDACVTEGRKAIMSVAGLARPEWGSPVVYTRAPNGRLFFRKSEYPRLGDLPSTSGFVGRTRELELFTDRLRSQRTAVIYGMSGVGKTIFAAVLAKHTTAAHAIFWHTFHAGEDIQVLIWALGAFLARNQHTDLWQMLQANRQAGAQPIPAEALVGYVLQELQSFDGLLCLDDFQSVADDPVIAQFVQQLCAKTQISKLAVLIISSETFSTIGIPNGEALRGLSALDSRDLAIERGLSLSSELIDALYNATDGNAAFLTLAIDALRQAEDPAALIDHLADSSQLEEFLNRTVYDQLDVQERSVMEAVACLQGYAATRDAIEAVLDTGGLKRTLSELQARHLLITTDDGRTRRYKQVALIQAYYYDMLSSHRRILMHQRAGSYYELHAPDPLIAASHYIQADAHPRAIGLIMPNLQQLVNQGQTQLLRQLLERLAPERLSNTQRFEVMIARSRVYRLTQARGLAQTSCQAAASTLSQLPITPEVHLFRAQLAIELGLLSRKKNPRGSLQHFHSGLKELQQAGGSAALEEAILWLNIGAILIEVGKYLPAERALLRALQLLPDATQRRANVLMNLGTTYLYRGELQQAEDYYQRALELYRSLHSQWRIPSVQINLGLVLEALGNWRGAEDQYQSAREQAAKVGNVEDQILAHLNVGNLWGRQDRAEQAASLFAECLGLAQAYELDEYIVAIRSSQADLYLRLKQWDLAEQALAGLEQAALDVEAKDTLPEIYRSWAQLHLAHAALPNALEQAQRAVDAAQALGSPVEQGKSLRVLGSIQARHEPLEAARQTFEHSLALLNNRSLYESAITMQWLGATMQAANDPARERMLSQAHAAFVQLGIAPYQVVSDDVAH